MRHHIFSIIDEEERRSTRYLRERIRFAIRDLPVMRTYVFRNCVKDLIRVDVYSIGDNMEIHVPETDDYYFEFLNDGKRVKRV